MNLIDKIKIYLKIKKPLEDIMEETKELKKGYKTIEFWVAVLVPLTSIVASLNQYIPAKVSLVISAVLICAYNFLRAIQNSQVSGVEVWYKSTRFWSGAFGIILTAFISIQDGGINAPWVGSTIAFLSAVIVFCQKLGAQQPTPNLPGDSPPPKAS